MAQANRLIACEHLQSPFDLGHHCRFFPSRTIVRSGGGVRR